MRAIQIYYFQAQGGGFKERTRPQPTLWIVSYFLSIKKSNFNKSVSNENKNQFFSSLDHTFLWDIKYLLLLYNCWYLSINLFINLSIYQLSVYLAFNIIIYLVIYTSFNTSKLWLHNGILSQFKSKVDLRHTMNSVPLYLSIFLRVYLPNLYI